MCGIAGLLGQSHDRFAQAVAERLRRRGPDSEGRYSNEYATRVHSRLAIMDPSSAGHQPMMSSCGRYVIVFNGEIFNYRELRRMLVERGIAFRSSSDTEVVLQLFICYGTPCLSRLRGMYAFCVWDRAERTAFVARDPLGNKQLYFWRDPNDALGQRRWSLLVLGEWLERHMELSLYSEPSKV